MNEELRVYGRYAIEDDTIVVAIRLQDGDSLKVAEMRVPIGAQGSKGPLLEIVNRLAGRRFSYAPKV